jgi:hypothetical protein
MRVSLKYRHITSRLTNTQLQKIEDDTHIFDEADLFHKNVAARGHHFFLGFYSKPGLNTVFEKYGIYKKLAKKGFKAPILTLDTSDPYVHKIYLHNQAPSQEQLLAEAVVKLESFKVQMPFETTLNNKIYQTISIEWMRLQNPNKSFSKDRPRLPGQHHPGLGIAADIVELLIVAAWRLKKSGLRNSPEQYHNACLYSRIFTYENPVHQAKLKAITRDLNRHSLSDIAWAMEAKAIIEKNSGQIEEWFAGKQIIPIDSQLKKLYTGGQYFNAVKKLSKNYHYYLDMDKYQASKRSAK